ncbi:hypothetical protein [Chitinophaga sp. YIM B06452]|uniref:hypothetical protein n=1 Tax=Chitinophaga sp. YIM B06452 TaxID=3082158 RepID=UPI0031FE6D59
MNNSIRKQLACSIIIFWAFIMPSIALCGQDLKMMKLTKSDIRENVRWRYEFTDKTGYYKETIFLYKNGRFKYFEHGCLFNFYSTGKWEISNSILVLNNDIKKEDVPASISYSNDTTDIFGLSIFGIVRNRKGESISSAFVNINTDSVRCLPAYELCDGSYKTIDSVRLIFENGFTSKWMKVLKRPEKYIFIKVETDLEIESYISFDNFKYRLARGLLKPIEVNK